MSDQGDGNTLTYRVTLVEREVEKLEKRWDESFSDLREQLVKLNKEVAVFHTEFIAQVTAMNNRLDLLDESVDEDLKGFRKVLMSVGAAVLIAALTFAITSLAVFGGPS